MSEQFDSAAELQARTHEAGLLFLRTELELALSLLDMSDPGYDQEAAARRRELAHEAYNVVSKYLTGSRTDALSLSLEERTEISRLHTELRRRLDELGEG